MARIENRHLSNCKAPFLATFGTISLALLIIGSIRLISSSKLQALSVKGAILMTTFGGGGASGVIIYCLWRKGHTRSQERISESSAPDSPLQQPKPSAPDTPLQPDKPALLLVPATPAPTFVQCMHRMGTNFKFLDYLDVRSEANFTRVNKDAHQFERARQRLLIQVALTSHPTFLSNFKPSLRAKCQGGNDALLAHSPLFIGSMASTYSYLINRRDAPTLDSISSDDLVRIFFEIPLKTFGPKLFEKAIEEENSDLLQLVLFHGKFSQDQLDKMLEKVNLQKPQEGVDSVLDLLLEKIEFMRPQLFALKRLTTYQDVPLINLHKLTTPPPQTHPDSIPELTLFLKAYALYCRAQTTFSLTDSPFHELLISEEIRLSAIKLAVDDNESEIAETLLRHFPPLSEDARNSVVQLFADEKYIHFVRELIDLGISPESRVEFSLKLLNKLSPKNSDEYRKTLHSLLDELSQDMSVEARGKVVVRLTSSDLTEGTFEWTLFSRLLHEGVSEEARGRALHSASPNLHLVKFIRSFGPIPTKYQDYALYEVVKFYIYNYERVRSQKIPESSYTIDHLKSFLEIMGEIDGKAKGETICTLLNKISIENRKPTPVEIEFIALLTPGALFIREEVVSDNGYRYTPSGIDHYMEMIPIENLTIFIKHNVFSEENRTASIAELRKWVGYAEEWEESTYAKRKYKVEHINDYTEKLRLLGADEEESV